MPPELFNFIYSQATYFYVFLLTLLVMYSIIKAVKNEFSTAQFYNVVAIVMGTFLMLQAGKIVYFAIAIPLMLLAQGFLAFAFFHASGHFIRKAAREQSLAQNTQA